MNFLADLLLSLAKLVFLFGCWELGSYLYRIRHRRTRHRSTPIKLRVWREEGVEDEFRGWVFNEPPNDTIDPITKEPLMNGWTAKELKEIASRRSEWGI